MVVTVASVKTFFGYSKAKQDEHIKLAEAPSGAHTEGTYTEIEEAELDEAGMGSERSRRCVNRVLGRT
jgi:hypothetical protein